MLKRLLAAALCILPSLAWGASSNVNSLTSSGAIVGSQQLYCPTTGAAADLKCTFTQVDAFINAQFSGDMTANGTGTTTVGSIGGKAVALGAALTTTGAGATTLAFGASTQTYTFPSATATLLGNAFPMTVSGTTTSGGIPYFSSTTALSSSAALAANAIVLGGGAGAAPASTTTGSGVVTAIGNGVNTNGGLATASTTSVVVGAINTGGGSGTAPVGLADVATGSYLESGGVTTIPAWQAFGTNVQAGIAAASNSTTANSLATTAAPLTVGTGGTISTADGYYICTTTCAITLPTPAAGFQFCIRNDSAVTTVITISAITSVQFEKTTYNGYGTVTTGTMVSGGALGDKICLHRP